MAVHAPSIGGLLEVAVGTKTLCQVQSVFQSSLAEGAGPWLCPWCGSDSALPPQLRISRRLEHHSFLLPPGLKEMKLANDYVSRLEGHLKASRTRILVTRTTRVRPQGVRR